MKRTRIELNVSEYPDELKPFILGAKVYDSSCSPEARVLFIDKDCGYYLKSAPKGSLKREALMDSYFHKKNLGADVLSYISRERDWLLTEKLRGEDCTHAQYMSDPKRMCDTVATLLRTLHEIDFSDCPVKNRTLDYLETVEANFKAGVYDTSLFREGEGFEDAQSAWKFVDKKRSLLKNDTLIHGDYCLPNIMLDDWKFSGFIDLGNGGVGDRHIDLFWGAWTLNFNLKTDKYRERFFDCYGRDAIDKDIIDVVCAAEAFG